MASCYAGENRTQPPGSLCGGWNRWSEQWIYLRIRGGTRLSGTVAASGSKNAALPIMAASILADGPVTLAGVPHLADVDTLALLLGHLGVEAKRGLDDKLRLETVDPTPTKAAVRPGAAHAGQFLRAGTACGATRPRGCVAARRMQYRNPAG